MLHNKNRVNKKVFKNVFEYGEVIYSEKIYVKILPSYDKHNRFSCVIPKNVVKNAAGRNRIRRLCYQSIQKKLSFINKLNPINGIVFFKRNTSRIKLKEVDKEIKKILKIYY